jgi:hypothetical protein
VLGADLSDQMAQRLGRENRRVEKQLATAQIRRRRLFLKRSNPGAKGAGNCAGPV